MQPILENRDVVYGSRLIRRKPSRSLLALDRQSRAHDAVEHGRNLNLTDMETCYKVFRRGFSGRELKSNRFGFEPEITAKIAKHRNPKWRVYESHLRQSYLGKARKSV